MRAIDLIIKIPIYSPDIHDYAWNFRFYLTPMAPVTIDPTLDLYTRYQLHEQQDGPRQYGVRSLPNTFTHDEHWELNPRPSYLELNALFTWPQLLLLMWLPEFIHSADLTGCL